MPSQPVRVQLAVRVALRSPDETREDPEGVDLICPLILRVEVKLGRTVPIRFRVDTGATRSVMSLVTAEFYGLPVPDATHDRVMTMKAADGRPQRVKARDGRLKAWWDAGRKGDPFDWPITFLVDGPAGAEPLLGLGGVIRDCRWEFDGRPDGDALFGTATFIDVRSDAVG